MTAWRNFVLRFPPSPFILNETLALGRVRAIDSDSSRRNADQV